MHFHRRPRRAAATVILAWWAVLVYTALPMPGLVGTAPIRAVEPCDPNRALCVRLDPPRASPGGTVHVRAETGARFPALECANPGLTQIVLFESGAADVASATIPPPFTIAESEPDGEAVFSPNSGGTRGTFVIPPALAPNPRERIVLDAYMTSRCTGQLGPDGVPPMWPPLLLVAAPDTATTPMQHRIERGDATWLLLGVGGAATVMLTLLPAAAGRQRRRSGGGPMVERTRDPGRAPVGTMASLDDRDSS